MSAPNRIGDARGELSVLHPMPGVVAMAIEGRLGEGHVGAMTRAWSRALDEDDTPHLFHDFSEMTSYESRVRHEGTRWFLAHRAELGSLHVVVTSPLARMGVQVVALALGNLLHIHASPGAMQRAYVETTGTPWPL